MKSDKIEQINKIGEMSSIRKICNVNHCNIVREMGGSIVRLELEIKKLKQQTERDHNIICELNNDNIILKQQNAELMDGLEKIKSLSKSKSVNNPLDQIYIVSDISIQYKG